MRMHVPESVRHTRPGTLTTENGELPYDVAEIVYACLQTPITRTGGTLH